MTIDLNANRKFILLDVSILMNNKAIGCRQIKSISDCASMNSLIRSLMVNASHSLIVQLSSSRNDIGMSKFAYRQLMKYQPQWIDRRIA